MQRVIFLLLTILLTTNIFGQKYLTADIRGKADSILRTYIGDTVYYKYCSYDTNTYYGYKTIFGKKHWETLNKYKKTKGRFVSVDMRWFLSIPYSKCPSFKRINGQTSFVLDSLLKPKEKPYLKFIPDFYWNKDSCNLISKETALNIGKQQHLKPAIDSLKAFIKYDSSAKTFSWEVSHTLWVKKDGFNNDYGEDETIIINAATGKIESHRILSFSAVY